MYNDDYCLDLCLTSLLPYVQAAIVFDDHSTDDTPAVLEKHKEANRQKLFVFRNTGRQQGWIGARQRLVRCAEDLDDMDWLWIDSDDIFCEYMAPQLHAIVEAGQVRLLCLCELWGDLDHTTQRLRTTDGCHFYYNRKLGPMGWKGGSINNAVPIIEGGTTLRPRARGGPPLFFHAKGVKDDIRLAERVMFRRWLRANRLQNLHEWSNGRLSGEIVVDFNDGEIMHQMALRHLLRAKFDRIQPTYIREKLGLPPSDRTVPKRPAVVEEAAKFPRFAMMYSGSMNAIAAALGEEDTKPFDRITFAEGR